ncbi:MAG: MTAP family purine nucleoside phosphorylase [Syntrophales bacterium]|nr:MTAP family purine nucleoside phosphorylase [Syntrophales bacterium]
MRRLGIISGTIALWQDRIAREFERRVIETPYGITPVWFSADVAIVARHVEESGRVYVLPHRINHPANLAALKSLGVTEVVGLNSVGSLKLDITPGSVVVPHDFVMLYPGPTIATDAPLHILPVLSERVREKCLKAANLCGIEVVSKGVYWQTPGPRLETKAEIAMMANIADVVGMTMASEAIIAREMEIEYASLCSVDNYAHGIVEEALSLETILENSRRNAQRIATIIERYIEMMR